MPKRKELPSQERLKAIFDYDPESGELRWCWRIDVPKAWNTRWAGKRAGVSFPRGYLYVGIDGRKYAAHRLIWKLMTGDDPGEGLDHWDLNGANNRWSNLRNASASENIANIRVRKSNKLGIKGVVANGKGNYLAYIHVNHRTRYLGTFATAEAAHDAYISAATAAWGEFARAA